MKCPDCKRPRSKCRRYGDELARGMRADMGGTDAVIASECALAAECARLTAQLAAATAERDEYAAMLDDSLAKWEALISTAGAICGHCKYPCASDAMSEHMRTCEKSPLVAEIARLTSALHGAATSTDCTCTHSGARHREEEGTGAARECLVDGCGCRQFGNVHMALAAATARAGEAAPDAVTGVVRKKMGNGARYIELDDHPHLTTVPRLPSKCGNGYIVEVRPLRAGGGR